MAIKRLPDARSPAAVDAARKALLDAVNRGRSRPPKPVVVPVADRKSSPVAPGLVAEDLDLCSERDHPQGWVPMCVVRKEVPALERSPAVIFLHYTGGNKETLRGRQEEYAALGYVTVAIDCRYHGVRAKGHEGMAMRAFYEDALVRAWKDNDERPFLLDTVFDLLCLIDYLCTRPDVDPERIGITGFSLGGIHAWLAGAADPRVAAVAAVSGVQGFGWAVANNMYHGRIESIPKVFNEAAQDLGKPGVDADVVLAVWDRIAPGLARAFDSPNSLPCIAPRPLLVATGETDPRCPLPGVLRACKVTKATYIRHVQEERAAAKGTPASDADADADATPTPTAEPSMEEPSAADVEDVELQEKMRPVRVLLDEILNEPDAQGEEAADAAEREAAAAEAAEREAAEREAAREARRQALAAAAEERRELEEAVARRFAVLVEPGVGHEETASMNKAVLEFLNRHLLLPAGAPTGFSAAVRRYVVM